MNGEKSEVKKAVSDRDLFPKDQDLDEAIESAQGVSESFGEQSLVRRMFEKIILRLNKARRIPQPAKGNNN